MEAGAVIPPAPSRATRPRVRSGVVIAAGILAGLVPGCATPAKPNLVRVSCPGIEAVGPVRRSLERVRRIEITPAALDPAASRDLWVAFPPGRRTAVADLTEEIALAAVGPAGFHTGPDGVRTCRMGGFTFDYSGGVLLRLIVTGIDQPEGVGSSPPRLGSAGRGTSVVLPCSPEEFSAVFGPGCEVMHVFAW